MEATLNTLAGQIQREKQKLHREELKLARLKTKTNKARQADARMKLRLGNLLHLVGWDQLGLNQIEKRLLEVKTAVSDKSRIDQLQISGQKTLNALSEKKREYGETRGMSPDQIRELNHQKITVGGLFVKFGLEKFNRAAIFGAIIEMNETPGTSPT